MLDVWARHNAYDIRKLGLPVHLLKVSLLLSQGAVLLHPLCMK